MNSLGVASLSSCCFPHLAVVSHLADVLWQLCAAVLHCPAVLLHLAAVVSHLADAVSHTVARALRQIAVELHIVVVLQS